MDVAIVLGHQIVAHLQGAALSNGHGDTLAQQCGFTDQKRHVANVLALANAFGKRTLQAVRR